MESRRGVRVIDWGGVGAGARGRGGVVVWVGGAKRARWGARGELEDEVWAVRVSGAVVGCKAAGCCGTRRGLRG